MECHTCKKWRTNFKSGGVNLMSKRVVTFLILIVIIGGFVFIRSNNNINHNSVTSGLVINKDIKPYRITIRMFAENTSKTKDVEVIIKDENVWNLIEKERYYFVTYFWKNDETPVLGQIEINDEFGKIYKDKINK